MSVAQFGSVAQLYRVSDSGSEGCGLEPHRGHKEAGVQLRGLLNPKQSIFRSSLKKSYDL